MKRRKFVIGIGAALALTNFVRAEQAGRPRVVGVLMGFPRDDPEGRARLDAFVRGLKSLGWNEGANLHAEVRWVGDDAGLYQQYAEELVAIQPDVILAAATPGVAAVQRRTRTIPIVFPNVIDPVGAGLVESLAHPGGNTTGFLLFEYSLSGKWLEVLQELVPGLARVAVMRDPSSAPGIGQFAAIQSFAAASNLELTAIDSRDDQAIEPALAALGREPQSGVIVTVDPSAIRRREMLSATLMRHRLAAVFPFRFFVSAGGLAAYGPDSSDGYARAAAYVDRILKGEHPANLPVQAPTRYRLVINLKTAAALGLTVPPTLLAAADEVIE